MQKLTHTGMAKMKKADNTKCWQRWGTTEHFACRVQIVANTLENSLTLSFNVAHVLKLWPRSFISMHEANKNVCVGSPDIHVLETSISPNYEAPKCPPTVKWISQLRSIYWTWNTALQWEWTIAMQNNWDEENADPEKSDIEENKLYAYSHLKKKNRHNKWVLLEVRWVAGLAQAVFGTQGASGC